MDLKPGEKAGSYETKHYVCVRGMGELARGQQVKINLGETIVVGRSRHCDWSLRRTPSYLKSDANGRNVIAHDLAYNSVSRKHAKVSYVAPGHGRGREPLGQRHTGGRQAGRQDHVDGLPREDASDPAGAEGRDLGAGAWFAAAVGAA